MHTCAICLEDLIIPCNNIYVTNCSHLFHLNCINRSRERNRNCPLCRANIDIVNQQLHNRQTLSNSFIEVSLLQIILFILLLLLYQILEEKNDINKASFL